MENKIYKVLIIEDEELASQLIQHYLATYDNFQISALCADGYTGLKAINEIQPDLIFMDIEMPKLNGLEVLELCAHKPYVIFTTAYNQYAVKAFELNAIDYLLKPFSKTRFDEALQKVVHLLKANIPQQSNVENYSLQYHQHKKLERIAVKIGQKIIVVPVEDIMFLETDGNYVKIHTQDMVYLKEKTMKYFEQTLNNEIFIRTHRSYLVNSTYIQKIEYYDKNSHLIVLKDNKTKLKTSDGGYKLLRERLAW